MISKKVVRVDIHTANASFFFFARTIMVMEIAEMTPNEPNQLSETYSTKTSLAGKRIPVNTANTMRDSNIPLNFCST